MGTVSAHDRFVVNVSVDTALRRTFAPLPSRRASPLLRGHSAGVFEFCSGLVDLVVVGMGRRLPSEYAITSPAISRADYCPATLVCYPSGDVGIGCHAIDGKGAAYFRRRG